jgi:hypothetical protein
VLYSNELMSAEQTSQILMVASAVFGAGTAFLGLLTSAIQLLKKPTPVGRPCVDCG